MTQTSRMRLTVSKGAEFWNDSCSLSELKDAVDHGATGATSNPVIVAAVVKADPKTWTPVLDALIRAHETATEDEIAWLLIEEIGRQAASILAPVHARTQGGQGYLSMQVSPKFHANAERMIEHGRALAALAPNIASKVP